MLQASTSVLLLKRYVELDLFGGARVFRRRDFQRTRKPKRKRVKTRASSELHLLRIDQDISTLINVLNVSVSAIYGQYFYIIQVTNVCFFPSSLLRKTSKKLHEIRFISIKFLFYFSCRTANPNFKQIDIGVYISCLISRREMGVARRAFQKNDKLISFLDSQGEVF